MPPGTDDVCELPPDADGDGSRTDVDCDDADATRHPGALESCGDGIDQDCSGADLACVMPSPVGGSGGVGGPPGAGAGGGMGQAGAVGAQGVLEPAAAGTGPLAIDSAGQLAPAPTAGSSAPIPVLPRPPPSGARQEPGCGVHRAAPSGTGDAGGRLLAIAAALTALALRQRRRC
jgi:hypothetical protein